MAPSVLLALLVAAPPAASALKLAAEKNWDELYVAFATVKAEEYADTDRAAIGKALAKGCSALEASDAVMAFTLADRAAAFGNDPDGLLCLARSAEKTEQPGVAEGVLRRGALAYPERPAFALLLGKKLLGSDSAEAARLFATVKKGAREYPEAQKLLKEARRQADEQARLLREAQELEARLSGEERPERRPSKGSIAPAVATSAESGSLTYESSVQAGMRVRANSWFKFKYFNNDRDFGERAEYEGRVAAALDEAYDTSKRILGEARVAPVDVVLYTSEEFAVHFGGQQARFIAGLYDYEAMRLNNAAELSQQTKATLVHEYIHAVEHDVVGKGMDQVPRWFNEGLAEYVEWRYLGLDEAPPYLQAELRAAARDGRLPTLRTMTQTPPAHTGAPGVAYAASATAVRLLVKQGGTAAVMQLLRDVREGSAFEEALERRFGRSVGKLQEDLLRELSQR